MLTEDEMFTEFDEHVCTFSLVAKSLVIANEDKTQSSQSSTAPINVTSKLDCTFIAVLHNQRSLQKQ